MNCKNCKKPIASTYIKVDGDVFHPQCFLCAQCKKQITGSYQEYKGKHYHPQCYKIKVGLLCAKCGKVLEDSWIELEGKKFHPQCKEIRCQICGHIISEDYVYDQDGKYHQQCFLNRKAPRCHVCDLPIQGQHIIDSWGHQAHVYHGHHKTQLCEYCGRIISEATSNNGVIYSDGRLVCGICQLTAVNDQHKLHNATEQVKNLLATPPASFNDIPYPIPIQLVDLPNLKKQGGTKINSDSRGFTRSHILSENKKRIKIEHTIYILYGMPLLQFQAVLAHEMLHAWLTTKDITLPDKEMEGFCNLGSALIFQADSSTYSRLMLERMEKNPDPIYGAGYRLMTQQLKKLGWQKLKANL